MCGKVLFGKIINFQEIVDSGQLLNGNTRIFVILPWPNIKCKRYKKNLYVFFKKIITYRQFCEM